MSRQSNNTVSGWRERICCAASMMAPALSAAWNCLRWGDPADSDVIYAEDLRAWHDEDLW